MIAFTMKAQARNVYSKQTSNAWEVIRILFLSIREVTAWVHLACTSSIGKKNYNYSYSLLFYRYTFLTSGFSHADLFNINTTSGQIRTASPLDREGLCGLYAPTCSLEIEAAVQSSLSQFFRQVYRFLSAILIFLWGFEPHSLQIERVFVDCMLQLFHRKLQLFHRKLRLLCRVL